VISLEPELHTLRDRLGDRAADLLIARERREVFSLYPEIRLLAGAGAMLLATAAGIILKDNYERIGPVAIALFIALVAAACYVWTWRRRSRASIADDSVLLLGALLVSADVAFIESQFHLLGDAWYRHFLIVAVAHGIGAYLYRSRALLTLSIVAMAAWLGVEQTALHTPDPTELAFRALGCASVVAIWWKLNRHPAFTETLEHFGANFLLLSGFVLLFDPGTRTAGCGLTILFAAMIVVWGFKTRRETFVLYAFVYAVIAADVLLLDNVREEALIFLILLVSMIAAIVTLLFIHARFNALRAEVTP
jgi:hypothetical protein